MIIGENNGSVVNINIIQCVWNKWILYKLHCGGRAGALLSEQCPRSRCGVLCVCVSTAPGVCVC